MGMYFRVCPNCGAKNDPNEICDCTKAQKCRFAVDYECDTGTYLRVCTKCGEINKPNHIHDCQKEQPTISMEFNTPRVLMVCYVKEPQHDFEILAIYKQDPDGELEVVNTIKGQEATEIYGRLVTTK